MCGNLWLLPAVVVLVLSSPVAGEGGEKMKISSTAFEEGAGIPEKYSCDGEDISPPLRWASLPGKARSLVLICDDPDAPAGTWVHWVVYDLPAAATGLPEGVPPRGQPAGGGTQGVNSWGKVGYGGPCPPGGTHRYFFTLYALDAKLGLGGGVTKDGLLRAMKGHVIAEAKLMGTYSCKN